MALNEFKFYSLGHGLGQLVLVWKQETKIQAAPGKVGLRGKSIKMGQAAAEQILMKGHLGDQLGTEEQKR